MQQDDKNKVIQETDERQRLYQRAIKEREYLPIRGKWAEAVRKDRERKKERKRKR